MKKTNHIIMHEGKPYMIYTKFLWKGHRIFIRQTLSLDSRKFKFEFESTSGKYVGLSGSSLREIIIEVKKYVIL